MRMRPRFILRTAALAALLPASGHAVDDGGVKTGATLFLNACATCHGASGEGKEALKVPAIAGKPAWYILRQLENFRAGRRATSAAEPQAMIMAAMAKAIAPPLLERVAAHVETLPPSPLPSPATLGGANLAMGKELFEDRCMECHRFNGSGEMTFGSPPLTGLPAWYIVAQVRKFKTGQRGSVPGDQFGAKMVLSSKFVESDEALLSIAAYILTLNPASPGTAKVEALFHAPQNSR